MMQRPDNWRGNLFLSGGILAFFLIAVFFNELCESKPGEIAAALANIIAGAMALAAAGIGAFWINKQIVVADTHEKERIRRRFSAARAGLPLTLSNIYKYIKACIKEITALLDGENLTAGLSELTLNPIELPREYINDLLNIIEVADDYTANYLSIVVQRLQIHRSRISNLTIQFHPDGSVANEHALISQLSYLIILGSLIDNLFPYSRRMCNAIPELSKETIANTLVGLVMAHERYEELALRLDHYANGKSVAQTSLHFRSDEHFGNLIVMPQTAQFELRRRLPSE